VDHTLEVNGSANISFEWTWPGPDSLFNVFDGNGQRVVPAENEIDGFQVIVYQSTSSAVYTLGTSPADEFTTFVQANKRSIILYGVSPNKFYSFFVRAYRHVDADIAANGLIYSATRYSGNVTEHPYQPSSNVAFAGDVTGTIDGVAATTVKQNATAAYGKFSGAGGTLPAGNVEFNFASSTTKGGDALNVVNVGNQPASAVQGAVVNFNTRNDRLATAVANPVIANDGSELAHTLNTDGSTNISFVWSWTGDNSTIDGFIVYVYQSTNATPYVLGQDQNNELVTYVTPDRRALILTGVAVNNYYTFYVQAYRIVDNDVSSSGFIRSSAVKSTYSGSNPYLPASTPVFGGDITGTINGVSAATVQQNASAAYGKFSGTGGTLPAGNVEFNFAASGSKGGSALNTVAVGSQDATTVQNSIINFNTRNDRNSTAVVAPVIANDSSALHYTTNTDGSVNISFVWSWTGAAIDIDFFIVTVYQGNTSAAYTYGTYINDQNVTYVTPEKRAIFLYGVPADKYYTFFVQAGRVVDPDINASGYILSTRVSPTFTGQNPYQPLSNISFQGDVAGTINGVSAATVQTSAQNAWAKFSGVGNTIPAGNVEFNFAASGSKGGSALNTASVGSQTATTVQNSVINFNFRNDRNGNVVVDPAVVTDGTAVDHVVKTNGSVDISFEWTWGGSSTDIDGFIVYTYSTNSNASYTFGTNVQAELVNYVTPEKRAYILLGVSPDSYYTFGVQAYRVVDPDINSAGIIKSNIVKSLRGEENPYQPQTAPVFTGDIIGTINGTSSSTVLSNISTLQNQIATVDSGSAAYSLVRNPLFSDYASTTLPNYWTSTYTSGITRQTGVNSPYLVRTQNDAGQIIYFVQTVGSIGSPSISTNQYIVIEATVRLVAGTFAGSGVLFQTIDSSSNTNNSFLINFLTDADSTNTVVGGGIVGRTYTFTKLVQLAIPNLASFNLYAMGHHPVIGSIAATSTIDWMRVSCRQASAGEILANTATTTVAALTSTVTTFSGSIADLTGRTRAWIDLGVSSGTFAEAFVQLKTESSPGVNTSSIALGAQEIHLYNSGSGTFKRVLSITNGNAEFTGGLSVGTYIRLGNGNYWNVALQSKTFLISDGDVVNFGVDLGNIPTLSFQGNNLAPLSTGQTYNLYADNLSSTGFTARLKIVTPTTPMTYTLTTDAYSGTGPIRQMDKGSNPDSTDGTYHMVINGNISDTPEPIYNYYGGNIP
jgi:hypothetical protein